MVMDLSERYAYNTVRKHVVFTSSVFNYAINLQMVSSNPCRNIAYPNRAQKERPCYTPEEAREMLNLFEKENKKHFKYVVFFTLALYTGLRTGELLGLEWSDIDFEGGVVTVSRTSNYTPEKGLYTDTPKTENSYRSLRIPDEIIALLLKFRAEQDLEKNRLANKWADCNRLFVKWDGSPMAYNSPASYYQRFCKRTGMRHISPHCFRHTCASILISEGTDIKTVQTCLGHSSPSVTLNVYTHAFQSSQAKAMETISNAIGSKLNNISPR